MEGGRDQDDHRQPCQAEAAAAEGLRKNAPSFSVRTARGGRKEKKRAISRRRRRGPSSATARRSRCMKCTCSAGRSKPILAGKTSDAGPDERLALWGGENRQEGEDCLQRGVTPAFGDRSVCNLPDSRSRWKTIPGYITHLGRAHPDLVYLMLGQRLYIRRRSLHSLVGSDPADGLTVEWLRSTLGLPQEKSTKGEPWEQFRWRCLTLICGMVDPREGFLLARLDRAFTASAGTVSGLEREVAFTPAGRWQCGVCYITTGSLERLRSHLEDLHFIDHNRYKCR